ncbi:MAG: hypothetical protein KA760_09910 [Steroidobacteraceae bacterium]|uniref:Uncharacterized protein n=1 Tax=Thauera aminoaromatica TaxID=164330 RepID=A0A5C7S683_THASP|nr:hypothetical protein [Steroidobacteraceae bacterium]TXH78969.1 MAG: hypothetical protein E6Q80_21590 [Thauera aminoaromatica]
MPSAAHRVTGPWVGGISASTEGPHASRVSRILAVHHPEIRTVVGRGRKCALERSNSGGRRSPKARREEPTQRP